MGYNNEMNYLLACSRVCGAITLGLLLPIPVNAELTKCGTIWTNQGCPAGAEITLDESRYEPRSPEQVLRDRKRLLRHEFEIHAAEMRREHGVTIPTAEVGSVCTDPESSVEQCRAAVAQAEDDLNRRVEISLRSAEVKRGNKEEPRPETPNKVTIINDNREYYPRHRNKWHRGTGHTNDAQGSEVRIGIDARTADGQLRVSGELRGSERRGDPGHRLEGYEVRHEREALPLPPETTTGQRTRSATRNERSRGSSSSEFGTSR